MRIIVGCECSGVIRSALRTVGHDAWSCDIQEADDGSPFHIHDDILKHLNDGWDGAIFHPECTRLTVTANRWMTHPDDSHLHECFRRDHPDYPGRRTQRADDIRFIETLWKADIKRIAIENPGTSRLATLSILGKPTQSVHPWWFGTGEVKKTGWWLKNLPLLLPTNIVYERVERIFRHCPPSILRSKIRSKSDKGMANAIAEQWFLE